jgi:hypothetical protein
MKERMNHSVGRFEMKVRMLNGMDEGKNELFCMRIRNEGQNVEWG